MSKIGTAVFYGQSGTGYEFEVFTSDTNFNNVSAVYIFTRRTLDSEGQGVHAMLYIGETEELGNRIANHEKWPCVDGHNCNCICIHQEPDENTRLTKETDLRHAYPDTPCNDQ